MIKDSISNIFIFQGVFTFTTKKNCFCCLIIVRIILSVSEKLNSFFSAHLSEQHEVTAFIEL